MSEVVNAEIKSTTLGFHDGRGSIPTFWLQMGGDGWGQGFGGYKFGGTFTHNCIYGILEALEVESWEALKGTLCRIERTEPFSGSIVKVGHIFKDKWFDLRACAADSKENK